MLVVYIQVLHFKPFCNLNCRVQCKFCHQLFPKDERKCKGLCVLEVLIGTCIKMTLEDFFTLTEMKDGLTATARVKELVNVMKNEKECIVKNINDTTRQWSTVASAIAATENRDCLDLFISLDGLCFIDRWLKDAQKFGTDRGDSFVEESITALLRALENLRIDNQKSVSSGIFVTIKNLLGHSSSGVQEKARALFDSWKQDTESDDVPCLKDEAYCNDGLTLRENRVGETHDISPCNEENKFEPHGDEVMPLICSDVHQEKVDDIQMKKSENNLDHPTTDGPSIKGLEGQLDTAEFNQRVKEIHNIGSSEKLGECDNTPISSPLEQKVQSFCAEPTNAFDSAMEPESKEDIDSKTEGPCLNVSEGKMDDRESPNQGRRTLELETSSQDSLCNSDGHEHKLGDAEDPRKTYLSSIEDFGVVDEDRENDSDEAESDSGNDSDFFKPAKETINRDVMNKRSDIEELDYGMVDPLEVARQVAIEVEREMDCREASCSSTEKRPDSPPGSTNGKQSQTVNSPPKELQTGPDFSTEAPPVGEEAALNNSENASVEQENCTHDDMESSPITEAVKEPEANAEKGFCDFDLNEEVCSEDTEQPVNPISSTSVSIVSASRAAAATGLPGSPLQFEGTFGFKGPAATSAFRPASPRRSTEGEKTICTLGTHNHSTKQLDYHDFDLNVAECGDEKPADPVSGKQIPSSSGILSRESLQGKQIPFSSALLYRESSSVEASPRRSERLHLDLNLASEGGEAPSDWRIEGRLLQHRNRLQSPSQSSSSSSMRNIDLNDQPSFLNDSSDRPFLGKPYQNLNPRVGDSVISIMGARVEVNRKDFVPQTLSLPNGRTLDPTPDLSLSRTTTGGILGMGSTLPFTHSPMYCYSGYTTGPFTSAMYGPTGPIPYMMDSRGNHVVPQILGSASAFPHGFSQQPPFLMSMSGAPLGSNGTGPSGHSFDLNSGLIIEGGNREMGGLRQFLNPGQVTSQTSSSSGVGAGKRKEPESGWEPYPFNYKHHQSPWK